MPDSREHRFTGVLYELPSNYSHIMNVALDVPATVVQTTPLVRFELPEEVQGHVYVLDFAYPRSDAKFVLLQQIAQIVTVDQFDWWRAVTARLLTGAAGECAGGHQQALLASPGHRTSEVPNRAC